MLNFSTHKATIIKLIIAVFFTALSACEDNNQNDDAYLQVSIAGSSSQSKIQQSALSYAQDTTVNALPDGITRVDFIITDSDNVQSKTSITVGLQTQTIKLRVVANRNLNIVIEAITGNTVSFRGQSNVGALRPGQSRPLSVSLNEIGAPIDPPVDLPVTMNISQTKTSQLEGDNGTTNITFNVSLSSLANGNVTAEYSTADITAIFDSDYVTTGSTLSIPAGKLSTTITVLVSGDTAEENDETFVLTLSNVSANASLGTSSAIGTIISDDYPGRLNDTGVTLCGDYSGSLTAPEANITSNNSIIRRSSGSRQNNNGGDSDDDPIPGGQDAHFGRDVSFNDDSDGLAGFSYTKLDANGFPLADQTQDYATQPWDCVKDNYTGLIWEVKKSGGSQDLQNTIYTYSWRNTTGSNDGGHPGILGGGNSCEKRGGNCNTELYATEVNQLELKICGANNWRMPTMPELLSLVNSGQINPAIDINYFPNTTEGTPNIYWTSTPVASTPTNDQSLFAWGIEFSTGETITDSKISGINSIRLVREEIILQ